MVVGRTRGLGDRRARARRLFTTRDFTRWVRPRRARASDASATTRRRRGARGRRARRRRDARGRRAGATIARRVAVTRAMTRARGATPRVGRGARAMGVDDIARARCARVDARGRARATQARMTGATLGWGESPNLAMARWTRGDRGARTARGRAEMGECVKHKYFARAIDD